MCRAFLLALLLPHAAWAAVSAQPLTPSNTSVMGGERQAYSVRFFNALGQPAVGESVLFANDACGFFDNGGFSTTVVTDMTGVATAGFTARPQGITCWLTAQAGVQVLFNVFTYTLGQVGLTGSITPAEPRLGQSFTFTAGAFAGAYPIYDARVEARVVPSGAATIATVTGGSQPGRSDFIVTPLGFAPFDIEVEYRGLERRFAAPVPDSPLQDMWWSGPMENGWGMSVVQHGDRLFAAIYTYNATGAPTWYVMPGGTWNGAHTAFTGALYSPRGSPYTAYDASQLRPGEPVGSATITFNAANDATLDFTIGGVGGRKAITRQLFGPPEATAAPLKAGDMWWGGASENGWGLALLQQHRTLFGVWFTYDANGAPTWFVLPSGFWADANTWQGRIYRATGSPWLGQPYDATRLASTDVGAFTLRFDGGEATLTYTIDGKPGTMALVRQPF